MGMLQEFKEFALKGNMVDMAVGIVIGGAFGKVISALVEKVLMPPLGLLTAGTDFSAAGRQIGQDLNGNPIILGYGAFIQSLIDFLLVALALFIVIKVINNAKKRFEKEKAAAPEVPSKQEILLTEIRDALKAR
jgi:large conductance mechanosensitive channel